MTARVTAGPQLDDARPRLDRTGAQLGPREVHRHQAAARRVRGGGPDMVGHRTPRGRVVVRTVDPRHVHAALDQATDQLRISRGLRRQRDHDPGVPVRRCRPEQVDGAAVQQLAALVGADGGGSRRPPTVLQHRQHRGVDDSERGLDMRFAAAQRRQPESGQLVLQLTQVELSDGPVVHEVVGARPIAGSDRADPRRPLRLRRLESLEQTVQLRAEPGEFGLGVVTGQKAGFARQRHD